MKKIVALLLAAMLIAAFTACDASTGTEVCSTEHTDPASSAVSAETALTEAESQAEAEVEMPDTDANDSAADNLYTAKAMGLRMEIPAGWKEVSTEDAMIILASSEYPTKADNITILSLDDRGEEIALMDETTFASQFEAASEQVEVNNFKKQKVAGADAIVAEIKTNMGGMEMTQQTCMIDHGGAMLSITFTGVTEDLSKAFDTCLNTLELTK